MKADGIMDMEASGMIKEMMMDDYEALFAL